MRKNRVMRMTGLRRLIIAAVAGALAPVTALGLASPALATEHHPTGEFAQFADCPLSTPNLYQCVIAVTKSGEFKIGERTVPITNTVTLQGGFNENEKTGELEFIGAENGPTLSKTPQPVPGGLLDVVASESLPEWLRNLINKLVSEGLAGVEATAELAAPASHIGLNTTNLVFEEGTAVSLPVKIKLSNVLLGENCYIGSESHPVVIPLTTGKSGVLTGHAGEFGHNAAFTLTTFTGAKLVNNTFTAPKAEGCGGLLSLLINPAVNLELGLPVTKEGVDRAVLEGNLATGLGKAVLESEP